MKRISPRWASLVQPPRNPRLTCLCSAVQQSAPFSQHTRAAAPRRPPQQRQQEQRLPRRNSRSDGERASSSPSANVFADATDLEAPPQVVGGRPPLNAPSHQRALSSAKLAALHARLSLPSKLPLQTLARCLIDPSVDPRPGYNNAPFAVLGKDFLSYYTTEWLLCHYPRLPLVVLSAAQYAFVGPETLASMRTEWGVEVVAAPGPEVDPGLLQLTRETPGNAMSEDGLTRNKDVPKAEDEEDRPWYMDLHKKRRNTSSGIVYLDEFGDTLLRSDDVKPFAGAPQAEAASEEGDVDSKAASGPHFRSMNASDAELGPASTTVQAASATFIRALVGALYLHAGLDATKRFHQDHVLSRQLQLHKLFSFVDPARDLSRLCAREGFEPPVARLISETGRLSRVPVFVVGVFSGNDKLGEAAGSSLNEGRVRAAVAALKSWYLYSPPESQIMLPSDAGSGKWKPQMIDIGEIIS